MNRLMHKTTMITGATGGLGSAICQTFAAEGAKVVVTDVHVDAGRALAHDLGGRFIELDVADEDAWTLAMREVVEEFGRLDVLVNNAAILIGGPLLTFSVADFRDLVDVNQIGCFLGVREAARVMSETGGSIINISSVDGMQGTPGVIGYAATKWAVRGITRVAAVELGRRGIRVNTILPGGMRTPMAAPSVNVDLGLRPAEQIIDSWPLGRLADPQEVANAAVFLASDEASYCSGAEIVIDGGATAGPDYLDRSTG